jgi:ribosomal protein L3 glutamine methyltransferase
MLPKKLTTIRDFIRFAASEFARKGLVFGHGTDNALDEAFHLVLWALKLPADLPAVYLEATLTPAERKEVWELLSARIEQRRPLAYVMGEIQFCGLPFNVDERVLIPRSPIAELIETEFSPYLTQTPKRILDLCTGSGCIGIACAAAFPIAQVELADLSLDALDVARSNVARHDCGARVKVIRSDLFSALRRRKYGLIVSNPPYVPTAEVDALAPEFRHEPRMALEAGTDGMSLVERILREAPEHLTEQGVLVCEIGGSRQGFEARFPNLPAAWPEFARGGDGVFVINRHDLLQWLHTF